MTMTDRVDDGGSPSPAPVKSPVNSPGDLIGGNLGVDCYSQAVKALSERSPFDSAEVLGNNSVSLPSRLARLLVKDFDSHRKRKRQGSDTKKSSSEKSNIWGELERYFRELTLKDIERLHSSSLLSVESSNLCFNTPGLRNMLMGSDNEIIHKVECDHAGNVTALVDTVVKEENEHAADDVLDSIVVEVMGQKVEKKSNKHHAKLADEGNNITSLVEKGSVPVSSTQPCSSVEWVLGSRNRVLTTITRPTKKRKLLSENPGLERLMVAQPYEGSLSLCHVCCIGDTGDQLNKVVVCKSCKVVVHQKCYGIQGDFDESWVCSWCKHKNFVEAGHASSSDRPCVLCPKVGGALKRFVTADCESSTEFGHLFCAKWIPEVHIGNTRIMEPLVCAKGINDFREKLICVLCELKHGSCVQCSDGSCGASFHPMCAREAGNKLEIWGKFGCDDIELRAFCNKHSGDTSVVGRGNLEKNELGDTVGCDQLAFSGQQGNKIKRRKIGRKNGEGVNLSVGTVDSMSKPSEEHMLQDTILKVVESKTELMIGSGGLQVISEAETAGQQLLEDKVPYLDLGVVLKKLLDRGKVSLQQIANEIGISEDYLATKLSGNLLGPKISCKIMKRVRGHAFLGTPENDLTTKAKCLQHPKADFVNYDNSDAVARRDLDMPVVVPVKSVPPRRRTTGHIVKEDKVILLRNEKLLGNNDAINQATAQEQLNRNQDHLSTDAIVEILEKIMVKTNGFAHRLHESSSASESNSLKSIDSSGIECNGAKEVSSLANLMVEFDKLPSCPSTVGHNDGDFNPGAGSFVHLYIQNKLEEVQRLLAQKPHPEINGCTKIEASVTNSSPIANNDVDEGCESYGVKLEDLCTDEKIRILNLSPEDELEGEIIFCQQRLRQNAAVLKRHTDKLACKVVRTLPFEIDSVREQRWDTVFVNQYIQELKEARKRSRKERRSKEALALLAAATEAAAASTRVSLRKNAPEESSQQKNPVKVDCSRIHDRLSSVSVRPPKDFNTSFDFPKEHSRSCDICSRPENPLNPILLCLGCKVAVHLNCYCGVREFTGPWYCELCEESSSSKASRNTVKKPHLVTECALCSASNGAFRKSTDGQWLHAFCAEWVLVSTFRRGQVSPVEGMEKLLKDKNICSVCHLKVGACIKCNHGKCQATFHPLCARSAGYYMNTKNVGEKIQRKAYCSKHSSEQRAKAESQKRNVEDLKIVKQHRVELEKLRLLCERIVKREKLKRELVLCNHGILASRHDSLTVSMLVQRPFRVHEGSSESAATSLRRHSWSCSEVIQKSDDVTIDSALSSKRCIKPPLPIDSDQKTDVSSMSQCIPTPKLTKISLFAEKQIPKGDNRKLPQSREKNTKINEKKLVMRIDKACLHNQRPRKEYSHFPLDPLFKVNQGALVSCEREEVYGLTEYFLVHGLSVQDYTEDSGSHQTRCSFCSDCSTPCPSLCLS